MLKKKLILILLFLGMGSHFCLAQNSSEFQLATRLMQQQKYADASPILKKLVEDNPDVFIYADRLIDCLIQLKEYDEGLKIAKKIQPQSQTEGFVSIRVGELYHFKGEKEKAFNIWQTNLETHQNQFQLYINTARSMISRREYLPAVDIYKKARAVFNNERLFFGEIANAYMKAGEYELAIDEWLNLLKNEPGRAAYIQRSLLRFDDPILYDIIIVELDERLQQMSVLNADYGTFYQLLIWLLQENKLYRRALAAARIYESTSSTFNYSLFNLGGQLSDNNEFELAKQAFSFYIKNSYGEVKWRNMEELANTYSKWAKYIDDHSLDIYNKKDSLFHLSLSMLDSLLSETKTYSRISNVYLKKAELSLDFIFDLETAEETLDALKQLPEMQNAPELFYLQGRISLAKKDYPRARIQFTKANKEAGIGDLAEKTRYFLALTDFYADDYEFATIQLKSLGRQSTSYYANDALELRLWLQEGLSKDSSGAQLDEFAHAVFKQRNGDAEESAKLFLKMIKQGDFSSLKDDVMMFLLDSDFVTDSTKFTELTSFLTSNPITPNKEKLLWEQAKLVEKIKLRSSSCEAAKNCKAAIPSISEKEIYEKLILEYPQGFYAPHARERLTQLTETNS